MHNKPIHSKREAERPPFFTFDPYEGQNFSQSWERFWENHPNFTKIGISLLHHFTKVHTFATADRHGGKRVVSLPRDRPAQEQGKRVTQQWALSSVL